MEKSHFLTSEQYKALATLERRRNELNRRIETKYGSENSLSWDKGERKAINVIIKLIDENFKKEENVV